MNVHDHPHYAQNDDLLRAGSSGAARQPGRRSAPSRKSLRGFNAAGARQSQKGPARPCICSQMPGLRPGAHHPVCRRQRGRSTCPDR